MPGWWRRNVPIVDQAREDARLEPYLTRREKVIRAAAMFPMFALGIVITGVHGFGPPVSGLYLLLGALVWLLATTWLVAAVTVRLRRRARERRRADVRARRRRGGDESAPP